MRKVAFIAAIAAAASLTYAADADSSAVAASAVACHSSTTPDLACATRALDANGDGVVSPAEASAFAASAGSAADWTPLRPPQHTGLDFKDAATEPHPAPPVAVDHNGPPSVVLALLALAALVVLLRRKPR